METGSKESRKGWKVLDICKIKWSAVYSIELSWHPSVGYMEVRSLARLARLWVSYTCIQHTDSAFICFKLGTIEFLLLLFCFVGNFIYF
jgi:hypothetical protein